MRAIALLLRRRRVAAGGVGSARDSIVVDDEGYFVERDGGHRSSVVHNKLDRLGDQPSQYFYEERMAQAPGLVTRSVAAAPRGVVDLHGKQKVNLLC